MSPSPATEAPPSSPPSFVVRSSMGNSHLATPHGANTSSGSNSLALPLLMGLLSSPGEAETIMGQALEKEKSLNCLQQAIRRWMHQRRRQKRVTSKQPNATAGITEETSLACGGDQRPLKRLKRSSSPENSAEALIAVSGPDRLFPLSTFHHTIDHWWWKALVSYVDKERCAAARVLVQGCKVNDPHVNYVMIRPLLLFLELLVHRITGKGLNQSQQQQTMLQSHHLQKINPPVSRAFVCELVALLDFAFSTPNVVLVAQMRWKVLQRLAQHVVDLTLHKQEDLSTSLVALDILRGILGLLHKWLLIEPAEEGSYQASKHLHIWSASKTPVTQWGPLAALLAAHAATKAAIKGQDSADISSFPSPSNSPHALLLLLKPLVDPDRTRCQRLRSSSRAPKGSPKKMAQPSNSSGDTQNAKATEEKQSSKSNHPEDVGEREREDEEMEIDEEVVSDDDIMIEDAVSIDEHDIGMVNQNKASLPTNPLESDSNDEDEDCDEADGLFPVRAEDDHIEDDDDDDDDDDDSDVSEREVVLDDNVIDHIVLAAPDLEEAMGEFEKKTGVALVIAGTVKGLGIKCARISFTDSSYLEVIAPDPKGPGPIGELIKSKGIKELVPFHYAIRSKRAEELKDEVSQFGYTPDHITMFGAKADGTPRKWEMLYLYGHKIGGTCPFFINWANSDHPCATLPVVGKLKKLAIRAPEDDPVHQLLEHVGAEGISVETGDKTKLAVTFSSPEGTVKFSTHKAVGFKFPGFEADVGVIDGDTGEQDADVNFDDPESPDLLPVDDDVDDDDDDDDEPLAITDGGDDDDDDDSE